MLTDHDALFRAVCADHEDDTPRLAFADWFDENDQPERAAHIRMQVEFARLLLDGSDSHAVYEFLAARDYVTRPAAKWPLIDAGIARRVELAGKIADAWRDNGRKWSAGLPPKCGVEWGGFHRGFPGIAKLKNVALLAKSAPKVRAASPAVELVHEELSEHEAERLAGAGLLSWIRGLALTGDCADALRLLGTRPEAAGIRTLTVEGLNDTAAAALAGSLAASPHWGGLRVLDIRSSGGHGAGAGEFERLFRAPHLRGLRVLRVAEVELTTEAARAISTAAFPDLFDLRLTECDLDDDAAEAIANAPSLGAVRHLDLGNNRITGRGATALLCSPHLKGMAFVGLEGNPVRGLNVKAMKQAPGGGLRLFHCHSCRLTVKDVRTAVRSPRLSDLWYLDLDDNQLGSGAVREIVQGYRKSCPPIIWLTMNNIDDAGAELIANWPAASNLRVLELYQNPITDAGVNTLLASPHLKNLDGLGVPSGVSESVAAAMKRRFGKHARLE